MRVLRTRHALDTFQQRHLFRRAQGGHGINVGVQAAAHFGLDLRGHLDLARPATRNAAHGMRRGQQRVGGQRIRVGKGGFLAAHGTHAHALADREAAGLDDALFQAPALAARVLEVQIGVIDLVGEDLTQRASHVRFGQAPRVQQ
ncbi:hypothetical protein D3C71_1486690 [compost metagenome]